MTRVALLSVCVLWAFLGLGLAQKKSSHSGNTQPPGVKAEAAELNRRGTECVTGKRFEQAKVFFKQAIQRDPRLPDAYENLALIQLLEGDDVSAGRTAESLLRLSPDSYNARFVAGVAAVNQNNFAQGKAYLGPLIRNNAKDPLALAAFAVASTGRAKTPGVETGESGLLHLEVEPSDALLAGQIFRHPRLKEVAQKWIEANVTNAGTPALDLVHMLAAMYSEEGRTADAAALYSKILEITPSDVDALVELSELERLHGQEAQAASHLYLAKKIVGTDQASLVHFSQICMRRRMYVDARDALTKVLGQEPANARAWYQLGLAQFRIGETGAAEKDFKTALSLDENDQWSRVGLGAVLVSSGQLREAAGEFTGVVRRHPQNAAAHFYLGQIHRDRGEILLALRELRQAVNCAPGDVRPWTALGRLQRERGDFVSAQTSLEKAIELDPTYAPAHYQMAQLLRVKGYGAELGKELELFKKYHDEDEKKGIVGLVSEGTWDYAGFLPPN